MHQYEECTDVPLTGKVEKQAGEGMVAGAMQRKGLVADAVAYKQQQRKW